MKRTIITLFLIVLSSIAVFAQRDNYNFLREKQGRDLDCYNWNSQVAFERCLEKKLPICPKIRDNGIYRMYRDFPCREEDKKQLPIFPKRWAMDKSDIKRDFPCIFRREDVYDRYERLPKTREYMNSDKGNKLISLQFLNAKPEALDYS